MDQHINSLCFICSVRSLTKATHCWMIRPGIDLALDDALPHVIQNEGATRWNTHIAG